MSENKVPDPWGRSPEELKANEWNERHCVPYIVFLIYGIIFGGLFYFALFNRGVVSRFLFP